MHSQLEYIITKQEVHGHPFVVSAMMTAIYLDWQKRPVATLSPVNGYG